MISLTAACALVGGLCSGFGFAVGLVCGWMLCNAIQDFLGGSNDQRTD